MKVIANSVVHHMAKALMQLEVFLAAVMTIMTLEYSPAIQAVIFFTVMFFHTSGMLNSML